MLFIIRINEYFWISTNIFELLLENRLIDNPNCGNTVYNGSPNMNSEKPIHIIPYSIHMNEQQLLN